MRPLVATASGQIFEIIALGFRRTPCRAKEQFDSRLCFFTLPGFKIANPFAYRRNDLSSGLSRADGLTLSRLQSSRVGPFYHLYFLLINHFSIRLVSKYY
jgi:hypothetical protein